ncbi:DUF3426 domain-containing protein [Psychrobacter sp. 16-MNA-CIBAN-0192]|uniref:DUF3426 domain-containing protein n=1 Tax=Psychrobacter sp. 16-MNA-CIBAN-0192 TaxID=3140448 RepID=UPI00331C14BA
MTTVNNLQCPHCNSPINTPQAMLPDSGAKVFCAHCQRTFIVERSIANNIDTNNDAIRTDKSFDSDMLIHDDMEIDDTIAQNPIAEYDSLEGMNAWVMKSDLVPTPPIVELINNESHGHAIDEHRTDPKASLHHFTQTKLTNNITPHNTSSDAQQHTTPIKPSSLYKHTQPSTRTTISSTAANNIHASVADNTSDPVNENAWLEDLLREKNVAVDSVLDDHEDTELAKQLTEMGVSTINTEENTQARVSKIRARMQQSSTGFGSDFTMPATSTVLWTVGSGLLILLLLTQYMIFNIDNLAKNPALASRLQPVCSVLPCTIPPADINAFIITKPTVKASQVKNARKFSDIQAQLLNESTQTQLLPNLKVSIYTQDKIIGEFIAQPSDYLLSSETKLAAERRKSVMFTVPITAKKISRVVIEPFY